jgi:hypothetical protein
LSTYTVDNYLQQLVKKNPTGFSQKNLDFVDEAIRECILQRMDEKDEPRDPETFFDMINDMRKRCFVNRANLSDDKIVFIPWTKDNWNKKRRGNSLDEDTRETKQPRQEQPETQT